MKLTENQPKRTVPQSVFDSPEARCIAKRATKEAWDDLCRIPARLLDVGNPNHPIHSGLFGYETQAFLTRQR